MYFRALSTLALALYASSAIAIDFTNSKWIWTDEVDSAGGAPVGSRAFRRDFFTPNGKSAISANILIVADNAYTLYANGNKIGSSEAFDTRSTNKHAEAYCIRLEPDCNVFAVNATNLPGTNPKSTLPDPAGLLVTIEIRYSDGFTETLVTDGSWHAFTSVPAGFEQPDFDDSAWPAATVEANYGADPWQTVPLPASASTTQLQITDANWIWTNEVVSGQAPIGARAFRKDVSLPDGQFATSATILIAVDDHFTLYVQGRVVGSGSFSYTEVQRFVVDIMPPASEVSIAIYATNVGGPAGVIAAVELNMEDCECGSKTSFITDSSWTYSTTVPADFILPSFDDSAWHNAVVEGKYGMSPWGAIPVNSTTSAASAPLAGAPTANQAQVVT